MNQSQKDYFSKVEKKYKVKRGRHYNCPICGLRGTAPNDNPLMMVHDAIDSRGLIKHRWSFASGRIIEVPAEDTNVL